MKADPEQIRNLGFCHFSTSLVDTQFRVFIIITGIKPRDFLFLHRYKNYSLLVLHVYGNSGFRFRQPLQIFRVRVYYRKRFLTGRKSNLWYVG